MLSKARHFVPEDKLLSIYYAIFSSHMIFGCQTWGLNSSTPHFKKVITLQKRAMRIITFSKHSAHTEPLFKKLGILKIKDQISLLNCLFIHDQTRNILPKCFKNYFTPCIDMHTTSTRRPGSIYIPFVYSKKYGRQSFKITSSNTWNNLCETLDLNLLSLNKYNLKKPQLAILCCLILTNFVICLLPGNSATNPSPSPPIYCFSLFFFSFFRKKILKLLLLTFTSSNLGSIIFLSICLRIHIFQGDHYQFRLPYFNGSHTNNN